MNKNAYSTINFNVRRSVQIGIKMYRKTADKLLKAISKCTCSFTTVNYAKEKLENNGYRELKLSELSDWSINKGDKIYINVYDSSVFAFSIGEKAGDNTKDGILRLAAAHTDSPALYIKPNPEMTSKGYGKLNVEMYGGAILNTWLDRPLSVAGKLALRSQDIFHPRTVITDIKKNLFTIPNLAIHLNREINRGVELNRQNDMLPVCAILEEKLNESSFFMDFLAGWLNVSKEDILDYELYIYNNEEGCIVGLNDDIISSPRLDNITSVEAILNALTDEAADSKNKYVIKGAVLFDNEEIGNQSKQGADCEMLSMIIERIYLSLGFTREKYLSDTVNGFMLSADAAHGFHPNHSEKSDITNINILNKGIVFKRACSQTYCTDSESVAVAEQICRRFNIPYQKFASRSDVTTGRTLGSIANKYLPMRTVDVGVPVLAMHSAREAMGVKDQLYMEQLVKAFYNV